MRTYKMSKFDETAFMAEIVIQVKNKRKVAFVKELLSQIDFIEVVSEKSSVSRKKKLIADLKESVDFVNSLKKGKTKAKSLTQLLDEL